MLLLHVSKQKEGEYTRAGIIEGFNSNKFEIKSDSDLEKKFLRDCDFLLLTIERHLKAF